MSSGVASFAACLAFWVVLSGHFTVLDVFLGAVSAAGVALLTRELAVLGNVVRFAPRLVAYLPWLLTQIVLANLQVARIVLDPRLPIDPVVVRLPTPLSSDLARVTLGNSITLTPGTITLDVDGSVFVVHALTGQAAGDLVEGAMTERVARVFQEPGR